MRWSWTNFWIVLLTIFLLVILFSFSLALGSIWEFQVPYYLVAGWIHYLVRIPRELTWSAPAVISGLVYLLLAVGAFHFIARSITATRHALWPWRWSACISVLLLLVFSVSLAIGGIVHQAAWLTRAQWIQEKSRGRITLQFAHARELIEMLHLYADDHEGRYPSDLEMLHFDGYYDKLEHFEASSTYRDDSTNAWPAPWIYVRGLSASSSGDIPVLIAPHAYKGGKRLIATNDRDMELMSPSQIRDFLPSWKQGYASLGIPLPAVLQEYDTAAPLGQNGQVISNNGIPFERQTVSDITELTPREVWSLPKAAAIDHSLVAAVMQHYATKPFTSKVIPEMARFKKTNLYVALTDPARSLTHYVLEVDGVLDLMVVYTYDEKGQRWRGRAMIRP